MGLDFKIRDFFYPLEILRTKRLFDKNQYLNIEVLENYQVTKLKEILLHSYKNVSYYKSLFKKIGFSPFDVKKVSDIKNLPFLTREALTSYSDKLVASNVNKYKPQELFTSGTTGGQIRFLVDKNSNILEFVYYWRFWGWHGYKIGMRFAEFSAQNFTPIEKNYNKFYKFNPYINRLLVNSLLLSFKNIHTYIYLFKKFHPLFLKGLPSNLYAFAILCSEVANHGIKFKAIFSQGENLLINQKRFIEEVFNSPVYDSYGHMERTVAISQCPEGNYHVHMDYGVLELIKPTNKFTLSINLQPTESLFEIVGTSLYNQSMPLIRYKTGDLLIVDSKLKECSCKCKFPIVKSIIGREVDIVITKDKRAITALYVALDRLPGLKAAQIIQESLVKLRVRVVCSKVSFEKLCSLIKQMILSFTGDSMDIVVERVEMEEIYNTSGKKIKPIISYVTPEHLIE